MNAIELIIDASFVVQLVILILVGLSVVSWTFIFSKWREFKVAYEKAHAFEESFWSGSELTELYEEEKESANFGLSSIFQAGFREYVRLHNQGELTTENLASSAGREMRVALSHETEQLESHLNFLATVGSTSPYIGLFGTVWGIMDAFIALQNVGQATLALVAPGIAEALIATAIGLFAAIPAVIAYNRFRDQSERLISLYDSFIEEFISVLNRQMPRPNKESAQQMEGESMNTDGSEST